MEKFKVALKSETTGIQGEQLGLAVCSWSDDYQGKNVLYYYKGGELDQTMLEKASLIVTKQPVGEVSLPVVKVDYDYLVEGSVLQIAPSGKIRVMFNPESGNNALFVTDACNNYCVMCPQPPKPVSIEHCTDYLLEIISLIRECDAPESLGITGGEPTMIREGLIEVISKASEKFPETVIQLLSNGRFFAYRDYTKELGATTKKLFVGIPLFGATSDIHDYIVQAKGAFEQTINGIYECKRQGIEVELRVVLHKHTVEELDLLVEFIHRNLPFVNHVALMGMENMGFAKMNYKDLWIDPVEYKAKLSHVVGMLTLFGMNVSVFNLPFCLVDPSIWNHCRQSISDFKTAYHPSCELCSMKSECAGFFSSTNEKFLLTDTINIVPVEA